MSLATRAAAGRVSYAGPRPTHRLRRWPWFAKRNGGYENDEAWLRQKAPAGEDRLALLAVKRAWKRPDPRNCVNGWPTPLSKANHPSGAARICAAVIRCLKIQQSAHSFRVRSQPSPHLLAERAG